jgi:hypothetical protein
MFSCNVGYQHSKNQKKTFEDTKGVLSYPTLFSFMTYHWIVKKSNTTDATSGTGNAHTSGTPEVWHVF